MAIKDDSQYPALTELINEVQDLKDSGIEAVGKEIERIANENIRIANEAVRQARMAELENIDAVVLNEELKEKVTKHRKFPAKIATNFQFTTSAFNTLTELYDFWKNSGIEKVVFTLHLDGTQNTPTENLTNVQSAINQAKTMFAVDTLKLHCTTANLASDTTTQTNYQNSIMSVLDSIGPSFTDVIILNERADVHNNSANATYCTNLIQAIKNRGFKVGISFQGEKEIMECAQLYSSIFDALDTVGLNCYPSISVKMQATSNGDSLYAWKTIARTINYMKYKYPSKKIVISETGILPYWEMLADPWIYDTTGKTLADERINEIFLYGLFESDIVVNANEIWLWFMEAPIIDSTTKAVFNHDNFGKFINSYL